MADQKPRPGITGDTLVLSARVPETLYNAAVATAGGKAELGRWLRSIVSAAVAGKPQGAGALQSQGFQEGKRQGWAHGNAVFREALQAATAKLKG
jgi:hypothetical protein